MEGILGGPAGSMEATYLEQRKERYKRALMDAALIWIISERVKTERDKAIAKEIVKIAKKRMKEFARQDRGVGGVLEALGLEKFNELEDRAIDEVCDELLKILLADGPPEKKVELTLIKGGKKDPE